jgi:endonuclease/exonuclease/phosphatase family metal-dependent hydrolase
MTASGSISRVLTVAALMFASGCLWWRGPAVAESRVPPRGGPRTLDVASWNVEWFGSTRMGPADEALQLRRVAEVVRGLEMDLLGLEEIVDAAQWRRLLDSIPAYGGVLSGDSGVAGGPAGYAADEQKVALLYRRSMATLVGARLILSEHDYDVGRRPPMEVRLRVARGGRAEELVVIVMHAKSSQDSASYQRRQNAGRALKAYLDATYPTQRVLVIGDWNDDVDESIAVGRPSPYLPLVEDTARYRFATRPLSDAHISSMAEWPETIDHHMVSDELYRDFIPGSAEVFRVDRFIPGYVESTSDHFPVITRYSWR